MVSINQSAAYVCCWSEYRKFVKDVVGWILVGWMVAGCMVAGCMVAGCMVVDWMVGGWMVVGWMVAGWMVAGCMVAGWMVAGCMVVDCMVVDCMVVDWMVVDWMVGRSLFLRVFLWAVPLVWAARCPLRWLVVRNDKSQILHLNGREFVWILKWIFKLLAVESDLKQICKKKME